jgi:hypothetical protein
VFRDLCEGSGQTTDADGPHKSKRKETDADAQERESTGRSRTGSYAAAFASMQFMTAGAVCARTAVSGLTPHARHSTTSDTLRVPIG